MGDVDMVLPPNNFGGLINESSLGLSIVGSDMMLPFNNNSQGNIIGTFMGIGQHDENQGGSVNNINIGLWGHQITLGANNDGAALERSIHPNFVCTTNGENLNLGFPSHANLASTGERSDIE
ncbi:hypothetical protein JHK82_054191 [Glycine max]|nr:hypothetical protein JHK82_054191 [Glycine max]